LKVPWRFLTLDGYFLTQKREEKRVFPDKLVKVGSQGMGMKRMKATAAAFVVGSY